MNESRSTVEICPIIWSPTGAGWRHCEITTKRGNYSDGPRTFLATDMSHAIQFNSMLKTFCFCCCYNVMAKIILLMTQQLCCRDIYIFCSHSISRNERPQIQAPISPHLDYLFTKLPRTTINKHWKLYSTAVCAENLTTSGGFPCTKDR